MKKLFIPLLSFILIFAIVLSNRSIVNAANNSTNVLNRLFVHPFSEPKVDGHHGYVNLLLQNKNNPDNLSVRTYAFSATEYSSDWHVDFRIYVGTDVISINFAGTSGMHVDTYFSNSGKCYIDETIYTSGNYFSYDLSSVWDIVSYQVYFPLDRWSCNWEIENATNFTVLWSPDSALYQELVVLSNQLSSINGTLGNINTSNSTISTDLKTVISRLNTIITSLSNIKLDTNAIIGLLTGIEDGINDLYGAIGNLDGNITSSFIQMSSALQSLSDKIDDLVDIYNAAVPPEDEIVLEDLKDKTDEQVGDIEDSLEELDKVDKPTSEELGETVDDVIEEEEDNIDDFTNVFSTVFENEIILKMLIIVSTVSLIAYVLYGKKG